MWQSTSLVLGCILWIIALRWVSAVRRRRFYRNRVWCIHRLNDVVALVPRDVYDRESRKHWLRIQDGSVARRPTSGDIICPPRAEVVVVHASNAEHLTEGLLLEARSFYIAHHSPQAYSASLYKYLHGHPPLPYHLSKY